MRAKRKSIATNNDALIHSKLLDKLTPPKQLLDKYNNNVSIMINKGISIYPQVFESYSSHGYRQSLIFKNRRYRFIYVAFNAPELLNCICYCYYDKHHGFTRSGVPVIALISDALKPARGSQCSYIDHEFVHVNQAIIYGTKPHKILGILSTDLMKLATARIMFEYEAYFLEYITYPECNELSEDECEPMSIELLSLRSAIIHSLYISLQYARNIIVSPKQIRLYLNRIDKELPDYLNKHHFSEESIRYAKDNSYGMTKEAIMKL